MLFNLCKSITRAVSVLALHCSGNPGITPNLREYLWMRIRAKDPNIKVHKVEVETIHKKTTLAQIKQLDTLQKQKKIQDCTSVRENKKRALDDCRMTEVSANHHIRTLVFTRILGHKNDIPGSG
jgi:phosphorylcholine metabolism protein LicD